MFTDPLKNLKAFEIRETDVIADIGAGTGFYSVLAAGIAPKGRVYAIDLSRDYLETIRNKARTEKIGNIEVIQGDAEKIGGTKIGDGSVDKVIASNVFFQVADKGAFIQETKRILKRGGRVLFIDWSADSPLPHKAGILREDKAKKMFTDAGFLFERSLDAGEHHYGMIFIKE